MYSLRKRRHVDPVLLAEGVALLARHRILQRRAAELEARAAGDDSGPVNQARPLGDAAQRFRRMFRARS